MATDRTNQQIKLKDGRMLGYAEYGAPEGKPVFYFHGYPCSRLDWAWFDAGGTVAAKLNARIISVDRPGFGLSDFKPDRELLDWPDDVVELADALQLDRFAVMGLSGVGPHAAACAFKIPGRLTATALVGPMAPVEVPGVKEGPGWGILIGKSPEERRPMLMGLLAQGIDKAVVPGMKQSLPEGHPDLALVNQPEVESAFTRTWAEAFRSGIDGADQEAELFKRPWGFQLQDITAEVHMWYGKLDANLPVKVGQYVADAIPNCHAKYLENEGHMSTMTNHIEEFLSVLVA